MLILLGRKAAAPSWGFASAAGWFESLVLVASAALALLSTHVVDAGWAREALEVWACSVPLLVGLKHGWLPSVIAAGVTLLALPGVPTRQELLVSEHWIAACIGLSLIVGHVTEGREKRLRSSQERCREDAAALESLFRERELLRLSHCLLEERVAAADWSLFASVAEAEKAMVAQPFEVAARTLLELLESQTSVRASAFHLCSGNSLQKEPAATFGDVTRAGADDVLVRAAFGRRDIVVTEGGDDALGASRVSGGALLAVPVVTTANGVLGVVAIYDLPFVAFHQAQFALIGAVVSRLADTLARNVDGSQAPQLASSLTLALSGGAAAAPVGAPRGLPPLGAGLLRRNEKSGVFEPPKAPRPAARPSGLSPAVRS